MLERGRRRLEPDVRVRAPQAQLEARRRRPSEHELAGVRGWPACGRGAARCRSRRRSTCRASKMSPASVAAPRGPRPRPPRTRARPARRRADPHRAARRGAARSPAARRAPARRPPRELRARRAAEPEVDAAAARPGVAVDAAASAARARARRRRGRGRSTRLLAPRLRAWRSSASIVASSRSASASASSASRAPRRRVVELGHLLQAQPQRGQRRAELVGDVAGELALARDHLGDALGAGVQRLGDDVDLRDRRSARRAAEKSPSPEARARCRPSCPAAARAGAPAARRAPVAAGTPPAPSAAISSHAPAHARRRPRARGSEAVTARGLRRARALGERRRRVRRAPATVRRPSGRHDHDRVAGRTSGAIDAGGDRLPALDAVVDRGGDGVGLALEPRGGVRRARAGLARCPAARRGSAPRRARSAPVETISRRRTPPSAARSGSRRRGPSTIRRGSAASSPSLRRSQDMCMSSVLVEPNQFSSQTSAMMSLARARPGRRGATSSASRSNSLGVSSSSSSPARRAGAPRSTRTSAAAHARRARRGAAARGRGPAARRAGTAW